MNEITELFKNATFWRDCSNSTDMVFGWNLTDGDRGRFRAYFKIPLDENILFARDTSFWNTRNQGLVITDKGFYFYTDNDDSDTRFRFGWEDFNTVKYQELVFYLYMDTKLVVQIEHFYLFKNIEDAKIRRISKDICSLFEKASSCFKPDKTGIDYIEEGDYDKAFEWANEKMIQDDNDAIPYFVKARSIFLKEFINKEVEDIDEDILRDSLSLLNDSMKRLDPEKEQTAINVVALNKAEIHEMLGEYYSARDQYIIALEGASNDSERQGIINIINSLEKESLADIWENYTDLYEYKDRKFLMPLRDHEIAGCVTSNIDVFRINNIPNKISFPMGHPIASQVYIGHPYNSSVYVPIEESEEIFFVDKVNELCYLLECLGAEEISIFSEKGRSVEEMSNNSSQSSASGNIKVVSASATMNKDANMNSIQSSKSSRGTTIKLDPIRPPYLPDNLVWYFGQPEWQRLVDRRLSNNILEYKEFISTTQTRFVNSSEKTELIASAQYLWMKANGNTQTNTESQFKDLVDTQWRVEVKFRSMKFFDNLENQQPAIKLEEQSELSSPEKEYIEEIRFCMEDGDLTEKDLRYLDRIRVKLGILPERAEVLIKMCIEPELTENEKEYIEAYKDEIQDGDISPKGRRLLDRFRISLGISEDRCKQLENLV